MQEVVYPYGEVWLDYPDEDCHRIEQWYLHVLVEEPPAGPDGHRLDLGEGKWIQVYQDWRRGILFEQFRRPEHSVNWVRRVLLTGNTWELID